MLSGSHMGRISFVSLPLCYQISWDLCSPSSGFHLPHPIIFSNMMSFPITPQWDALVKNISCFQIPQTLSVLPFTGLSALLDIIDHTLLLETWPSLVPDSSGLVSLLALWYLILKHLDSIVFLDWTFDHYCSVGLGPRSSLFCLLPSYSFLSTSVIVVAITGLTCVASTHLISLILNRFVLPFGVPAILTFLQLLEYTTCFPTSGPSHAIFLPGTSSSPLSTSSLVFSYLRIMLQISAQLNTPGTPFTDSEK